MSDNAESPTETQKEEPQSPPDDSTTTEEKKKSMKLLNIEIRSQLASNSYLFSITVANAIGNNSGCVT